MTLSTWEPLLDELRGLDAGNAEVAGRISLGLFFAETNGNQNMGNARSNTYKGSLQTGVSKDQNGQRKWAAIKKSITAFDPALSARDDKEEARVGKLDHRFNHWTAVRDALMNAHADLLPDGVSSQHARPIRSETRATLVASIARGRRWLDELTSSVMKSLWIRACLVR